MPRGKGHRRSLAAQRRRAEQLAGKAAVPVAELMEQSAVPETRPMERSAVPVEQLVVQQTLSVEQLGEWPALSEACSVSRRAVPSAPPPRPSSAETRSRKLILVHIFVTFFNRLNSVL